MDYRQIEMFRTVIDQGSVTAAALLLGVSQPAVSGSLSKLEKRLGFTLFLRDGKRLKPTAEAYQLYVEACRLLDGFGRLDLLADEISAGQRGTLTIASNPNPAISWLPAIAAKFRETRPSSKLRLLTRSTEEVRELALLSAFDLGVAEAPFLSGERVLHRFELPRVVVMRGDHPLAQHEVITPVLLANENLVATVKSSWSWAKIVRAFDEAGVACNVVAECEFTAISLNLVAEGLGVCLADPISAGYAKPGLVCRPFLPTITYELGLLGPAHGRVSLLAQAFVDTFTAHIANYLGESHNDRHAAT